MTNIDFWSAVVGAATLGAAKVVATLGAWGVAWLKVEIAKQEARRADIRRQADLPVEPVEPVEGKSGNTLTDSSDS